MSTTLEATGTCYQDALTEQVFGESGHMTLCHGEPTPVTGPLSGIRHGHAWLEYGEMVYNPVRGEFVSVPRDFFYAIGQIDSTTVVRYTKQESMEMAMTHRHYGPWD